MQRCERILHIALDEFTVFGFGGEPLNGNCSVGQLTTIGFSQHQMNGGSLRKAYVGSGFLSSVISPSEIYLRSDSECVINNPTFL